MILILAGVSVAKAKEPPAINDGFSQATNAGKEWGVCFPDPGKTPDGEETADYLQKYDAYFAGNGNEKAIYLTFDSGYESGFTESILDTLKTDHVPAAFFVTGNYIKKHPEIINRMVSEGHIVGNHTMTHPDMTTLNKSGFAKQLTGAEDAYRTATGSEMLKYYRPPCGVYSEANLKLAKDLGYKTIFWSLCYNDYADYRCPSKAEAFSKLLPRIHPGAVILLHSTCKTSAQILDELINRYRDMGYEFKSLNDLTGGSPAV
jgi:Predicted xylanase/chitin deacetylase